MYDVLYIIIMSHRYHRKHGNFIPKTSKNTKRPENSRELTFSGKYAVFVHFVHFFG